MKWKRLEPGKYESGDWTITTTKKGKWYLWLKGHKINKPHNTKKAAQDAAEEKVVEPDPEPTIEDAEKAVQKSKAPVDVDSSLRSIRLSVDSIAFALNNLSTAIRELAETKLKKYQ